ncbi:probable FOX2-Hydratase-dehydrogenase-epimerase, peroxisomal [Phialocephala subalpina]|uniref:Probable FOX2-Hydratase-dehydrogenase-epimerase, peroxisomal n=1 Tax=Phialocephala subalpina TaxID=576137 RepID=A0A1L7XHD6_9HELO|nr:probable FOX2-Hydratase-dehydrogenase-epimerase, peroxisomal [Phialocephala subalpina]
MSVQGRVAIVTGAGMGLGREYALALAAAGAKVIVNDYGGDLDGIPGTSERAQSVVDEITKAGGTATADGHDVSKDAKTIIAAAVRAYGTVDILVNNAGISGKPSSHDDVDGEAFMRVLEIGVLGTSLMTSAAYATMRQQGYGRVINVSSNAVYGFGAGGDCAYAASKGAIYALTRDLGRYAPRDGIKINGILPSGWSRMGDMSEGTKLVTRTYFDPAKISPFVVLLASGECPVSGEMFTCSAGRASRETLATYPGSNAGTAEGWLRDWDKVFGTTDKPYIATSCLDHVQYVVKNATGKEMEAIAEFGIAAK